MRKTLFILLTVTILEGGGVYSLFEEKVLKDVGIRDTLVFYPKLGIVLVGKTYRGEIVDTSEIIPVSDFLSKSEYENLHYIFGKALSDSLRRQARSRAGEGLIPDIEIPIAFPKGLGFIGEGGKLTIDGRQDITFGGRTSYWTDQLTSEYGAPSKFPQLEMDQKLQVRLTGTVGQKIQVEIDHDSERENQLKNKVKLSYKGDEDEIIQLIEAGDTRLQLPSTHYSGFSGGGRQGLFGIRTEAKIGPLKIMAIASREQGESQSSSYKGGAAIDSFTLFAKDYVKNKFFYLGENDSITEIFLFVDDANANNDSATGAIYGVAWFYWPGNPVPDTTISVYGHFNLLRMDEDFRFYRNSNVIELLVPFDDSYILGAYYITATGDTIGDLSDSTFLKLKLIRPKWNDFPQEHITPHPQTYEDSLWTFLWNLSPKNIYSLGGTNISYQDLEIKIFKKESGIDVDGENGRTYLEIMRLDPEGDGRVNEYITVGGRDYNLLDLLNGYLFFPHPFPFADTALSEPDSSFYWKKIVYPEDGVKYYIMIKYRERSEIISLRPFIIEGSEVVKYNGRVLERNVDYIIDYEAGIITIINQDILRDPNAEIEISYDYAPFFSMKQRSIVGTRFEYELSENFKLGSTWLLRSEGTIDQRPRLGEEPTRTALGEFDFYFNSEFEFLTRFINKLPLISTDVPSRLTIQGEVARSFPNPNTKGDAYLDDMEAVKLSMDIPIARTAWIYGSIPLDTNGVELDTAHLAKRIIWATPVDLVKAGDVYPQLSPEEANDKTSVMFIEVEPNVEGDTLSWASLNTLLSVLGTDLTNMDFLEIRVKGDGMKLHIDLGYEIPEDIVWRRKDGKVMGYDDWIVEYEIDPVTGDTIDSIINKLIRNEDRNQNGLLEISEDVGLDLVAGDDDYWTTGASDDGNDDFHYDEKNKYDYSGINGTEGNQRIDSEDLDNDRILTMNSNYFEITIDLDDTMNYPFEEKTEAGWRYYRIKLTDNKYVRAFGSPSWDNIKFARLWVSGFTRKDTLWIARMEITGSKWRNYGVFTTDTLLPPDTTEMVNIGLVNNKENMDYTPPPGVRLKRDQRGIVEREQSLSIIYENIKKSHYTIAHRQLYEKQDLLEYREIKFYVRAKEEYDDYPILFLRLGKDTNNYYEVRWQVTGKEWKEVVIPIDSLTQIKKTVLDTTENPSDFHLIGDYGFKGYPTFTDIEMYEIGIINGSDDPISGEIWVDELRLSGPRREGGIAFRGNLNFSLADIADFSLFYTKEEANFQMLTESSRSRDELTSYTFSSNFHLDKFLPKEWGFSIPISYERKKSLKIPKFLTGSDIILKGKQRIENQTLNYSQSLSFQFSKTGSKNTLLKWFVDPFNLRGNWRSIYNSGPLSRITQEHRDASLSYRYNPVTNPLRILGLDFYYFPSSFSFSLNYSRDSTVTYSKTSFSTTRDIQTYGGFSGSISYSPFRNMSFSYGQDRTHNLDLDPDKRFGREVNMSENISFNYSFNLFGIISPNTGYAASYTEDRSEDSLGFRNVIQSNNLNISMPLEFPKLLRLIASLRDESKDTILEEAGPLQPILIQFEKLSRILQAPTISYSISKSSSFYRLEERPQWSYRWGFALDPGISGLDDARSGRNYTQNFDFNGSIGLSGFRIGYGGNWGLNKNIAYGTITTTKSVTLPQLNFNLYDLTKIIPFGKGVIKSASFQANFSRNLQESEGTEGYRSSSREINFSPSMNFQFKKGVKADLNVNYRKITGRQVDINVVENIEENKGLSLNVSYTFKNPKGFKLPLIGKHILKIKSELTTNLRISYNSSKKTQAGLPFDDTKSIGFSFSSQYSFSRSITGGLNFEYNTRRDNLRARTYKDISLSMSASFKF
jgi:hypothetical protein